MNPCLQTIHQVLSKDLPYNEIAEILNAFESLPSLAQKEATEAGTILSDFSMKSAIAYFRAVPLALKWIDPDEIGLWVGMGIVIAQSVSASGIRYFREGPVLLAKIKDQSVRNQFLKLGISLARQNPNLAMEYYRQAPVFLTEVTTDVNGLAEWAEYGFTLGDHTLAVEYFRTTPDLLKTLSVSMLPYWVGIAKTLAAEKLLHAITFMRTSPEIFSKIKTDALPLLIFLGALSDASHEQAITCFQKSSEILMGIDPTIRASFLTHLLMIAQSDPIQSAYLFLHAPKILRATGGEGFLPWIAYGIELLKTGNAKGYFLLESKAAKEKANRLMGGTFLLTYEKVLQLFAEALCGSAVKIKSATDQNPTTDGHTIYLPAHIKFFENDVQNFEWYKIATAFQAGYLEFGTFSPNEKDAPSLSVFLRLFPKPDLIKKLFDMAEGARVEFFLKKEYPGLLTGLIKMRDAELSRRPLIAGLSPHECVMEWLTQISLSGKTKEPIAPELSKTVFDACLLLGAVQSTEATVVHSMKSATAVYNLLDIAIPIPSADREMELLDQKGEKIRGTGVKSGNTNPLQSALPTQTIVSSQGDAPVSEDKTPSIRGNINPEWVENELASNLTNRLVSLAETKKGTPESALSKEGFVYDEWDCEADAYRFGYCHIIEKEILVTDQAEAFAKEVILEYGGMIKSLKKGFQLLAPKESVWMKGQVEGEQFDFNRLIENRSEAKISCGGRTPLNPSEQIYMRRKKKERSVSALFLLDISGSTTQRVEGGKTILQIEKEALILLSNAIDAVGDRFAIYGFSGHGHNSVLFYTLKDFQTRYTKEIDFRISHIASQGQNRDGAAIRHAMTKLSCETAKTKLLVLISDGKPLDDQYNGSYAIADTKKALTEARRNGIHPFCITVDHHEQGAEYLKGMYGATAYLVIDKIESLPMKLPRIYKRLTA